MRDFARSEAGRLLIASWFKELCLISRGWQDVERRQGYHPLQCTNTAASKNCTIEAGKMLTDIRNLNLN